MISTRGTLRTCTLRMRSRREYTPWRSGDAARPSLTPAIKPTDGFWRAEVISLRSMGASFREFDIANSIDGGNLGFNKARHPVDVARTKFDEDAPT